MFGDDKSSRYFFNDEPKHAIQHDFTRLVMTCRTPPLVFLHKSANLAKSFKNGIIDGIPPIYLHENEMKLPGALGVTRTTLNAKTGSSLFTDRWATFANVQEFGLSGSAFTLDMP